MPTIKNRNTNSDLISRFRKNSLATESSYLILAQGFGMALSMLITLIRPKLLSVDEIGVVSYIAGIVSFMAGFFSLGLDNTISRLIVSEQNYEKRNRLINYLSLSGVILGFALGLILLAATPAIPYFGREEAVKFILIIFPFAGYNVMRIYLESGSIATGKRRTLIWMSFSYPLLYLVSLTIFSYFKMYNLRSAIILEYLIHFIVVFVPLILLLKGFSMDKEVATRIKDEQNKNGWKIYFSRIIFVPTFNLDVMILGAFHTFANVGMYSLANLITSPISVIGQSFSKSMYRRFKDNIPKKHMIVLSVISWLFSLLIFVLGFIAINYFFDKSYSFTLILLPFAIIIANIRGITSPYIYFMNVKGLANEVRKCAVVGLVLNIILNFSLIIPFGSVGAMLASIVVLSVNLFMRIHYVKRYKHNNLEKI
jgi:O-antigen/teichoic acid export membrane protein